MFSTFDWLCRCHFCSQKFKSMNFYSSSDDFLDGLGMQYSPIENYGIIGAMRTCALINKKNASIDFMCYPNFDSPSLFCKLLDSQKGGSFELSVIQEYDPEYKSWADLHSCSTNSKVFKQRQVYLPNSNVLVTRYHAKTSISQVIDLMPVIPSHLQLFTRKPFSSESINSKHIEEDSIPIPWIVRKFEVIRGRVRLRLLCRPHFNYARARHRVVKEEKTVQFVCEALDKTMELSWISNDSDATLVNFDNNHCEDSEWPGVFIEFDVKEGQIIIFVFREIPHSPEQALKRCYTLLPKVMLAYGQLETLITETNDYWHSWIRKCKYDGNYRQWVYRSALLLKLMTYYPTGAIIASPTFSVPEELGGRLNWDYRFTWIRDASFTIYAFIRLGLKDEANAFMRWIEERCQEMVSNKADLAILYDIRGYGPERLVSEYRRSDPDDNGAAHSRYIIDESSIYEVPSAEEAILYHLDGYQSSRPVRIGNGAVYQLQLDIYGELLDSIYLIDKYCQQISYDFWLFIKDSLVPIVLKRWQEPDYSIWEFRHGKQHYTYSKIMCWVAIDRSLRLATKHSFPAPERIEWQRVRDEIYLEIMQKGFDYERQVFTQYYGSQDLDASILIMPLVFFMPANDPRFLGTLKAVMQKPQKGGLTINHLCFRTSFMNTTPENGSAKDTSYLKNEGTFNLCTFWLIEALCRTGDQEHLKTAELMFEGITSFANHLGLFSEELSVSGRATGNFPQAFTHLSLISAAISMDRASSNLR
jgi:GH15 family glucan-1,4-alpha-glucosidase